MQCGYCGSGITADEKKKKLKDGSINYHTYYFCCGSKDKNCRGSSYLNEKDLIKQFEKIIDQISVDEISLKDKIREEILRMKKFQSAISISPPTKISIEEIDVKNYVKFVLREGTIEEKREVLATFRERVILKDKEIFLRR